MNKGFFIFKILNKNSNAMKEILSN